MTAAQAPAQTKTDAEIGALVSTLIRTIPLGVPAAEYLSALDTFVFEALAAELQMASGDVDAFWTIRYEAVCAALGAGWDRAAGTGEITALVIEWLTWNGIKVTPTAQ